MLDVVTVVGPCIQLAQQVSAAGRLVQATARLSSYIYIFDSIISNTLLQSLRLPPRRAARTPSLLTAPKPPHRLQPPQAVCRQTALSIPACYTSVPYCFFLVMKYFQWAPQSHARTATISSDSSSRGGTCTRQGGGRHGVCAAPTWGPGGPRCVSQPFQAHLTSSGLSPHIWGHSGAF